MIEFPPVRLGTMALTWGGLTGDELLSLPAAAADRDGGRLRDVLVGNDGKLLAVVVEANGKTERVPFGDSVRFAPASRSAA